MTLGRILRFLVFWLLMALLVGVGVRYARQLWQRSEAQTLRLAISRNDLTDLAIMRAFASELKERGITPTLSIIEVADNKEAAQALAAGTSDMAVVRPDVETPNGASAVLRLRASPIILVMRKDAKFATLSDLEGKVVGIDPRDGAIIDEVNSVFAQTQRHAATRKVIKAEEIEALLKARKIDIALFTPSLAKGQAGPAQVRQLSGEAGSFRVSAVQPDDVSAMVSSLPAVSVAESGLPKALRVEDEDEVVCAQFLLMARNALPSTLVATFTERMFYMRAAIAKRAGRPAAFSSAAGESVTASPVALHKGAIEYYEHEQKTFLERYSDLIWIGIAFSGMISSGLAWFMRRLVQRRRLHIDNVMADLATFAHGVRHASDAEVLAVREQEFDALTARSVELSRQGDLSDGDAAALRFAHDHAREALASARRMLEKGA